MSEPDIAAASASGAGAVAVPPRWGLGDVVVGFLLSLVGAAVTGSLALALSGETEFDELALGWVALAQTGLWLGLLGVPLFATTVKGNGLVTDLGLRVKSTDIPLGIIGGFATQVAVGFLYTITGLSSDEVGETAESLADRADDPFGVVMLIVIVGLGAPIFEEIFWRGLVQRSIERRFGVWPAVVVTAVVFAASHFLWLELLGLTFFGLVVGYLAHRTGRLGPSIAVHVGFNMTTVIALLAME